MAMFFVPGPMVFVMSDFLERVLKKHEPADGLPSGDVLQDEGEEG